MLKRTITSLVIASSLLLGGCIYSAPAAEQKIKKLAKHLLNENKKDISWKCFAEAVTTILENSGQQNLRKLAPAFKKTIGMASAADIGEALANIDLPEQASAEFAAYSRIWLKNMINWRIKLNSQVNCQKLKSEL